jgi:hypothetical protein
MESAMTKTLRLSTLGAALIGASLIGAVSSADACRYYGPGSTGCAPPAGYKPAPVAQPAPPKPTMQVGGAVITGSAYTLTSRPGQVGGVTYFGAPPATYQGHNGQVGNVTYLNGARPYAPVVSGGRGQVGSVTLIGPNTAAAPAGFRRVPTILTPGLVRR